MYSLIFYSCVWGDIMKKMNALWNPPCPGC